MTRKRYLHKCRQLILAIHKTARENGDPVGVKAGEALRHQRDHWEGNHKPFVGKPFASYKEAWDSLKDARKFYGLN